MSVPISPPQLDNTVVMHARHIAASNDDSAKLSLFENLCVALVVTDDMTVSWWAVADYDLVHRTKKSQVRADTE